MYHCHTDYSLLDSCTKPQEYVDLAVRDGMKALSFSEHGRIRNWTEKWAACKKAGIKYIHSVEIYLTESLESKVRDNYHTVLMAKNHSGLLELNRLVTLSNDEDHFFYNNRISFDEFLNISSNIISTSACLASPLNRLPDSHPLYMELAKKYDFLEIQAHNHQEQIAFNQRLLELARKLNKPLIAGTDTHSSSKYKAECRSVLLSSKHKSYDDEDSFDLTYKTYDELVEMFRLQNAIPYEEYVQAINNTNLLYDLTEEIELDTSTKYPILYGSREADAEKFVETVENKFEDKVSRGIIPPEQVPFFRSAIDEEMRVFKKLDMCGFMLSESELISWCKKNNIAIGTARGSVGGSRIAYVTDIIDLNPETWHTVFSRFCNEDRVEAGDIDTDVIESDRAAIFKYITDRFGKRKTARVASYGTIQAKGVIDDVGRHLSIAWKKEHPNEPDEKCPWSLKRVANIKNEFDTNPEKTKSKYPELFYYFDGLLDTKISQSIHPAGMVISPITLDDNYGTFDKDGDICLMLDMDEAHRCGLVKYDMLVLKTVQVIRDTCRYLNKPYPKTHEIDWDDEMVWDDMLNGSAALFQFESKFAYDSFRKFKPRNIFDMSLVTACIRPSGASYREDLLARKPHKNPSDIIDNLLKENLGYLIYQEDTIKFLQEVCGLSGSEADTIRRAIGHKDKDKLNAALPDILEGYCGKSDKTRDESEKEATEFLKVIEDSASYQFGYNHSIAYCLLGYLCGYYRYHHPLEFLTSFLNNAANEDDIKNGTLYATKVGIKITMPKWGLFKSDYFFDKEKNLIVKGLSSIKYMSVGIAEELYKLAHSKDYAHFVDVLYDINKSSKIDSRQLDILIKIDFFSDFGNQRELLRIADLFDHTFKKGEAKQISKAKVEGTVFEPIINKYSNGTTKTGGVAKDYTLIDIRTILREIEGAIKALNLEDLSDVIKVRNFVESMGHIGYVSGKEEDRRKLYITNIFPVCRKKDGKQFGYSILTKSIGSGKESRFTVFNRVYDKNPIKKDDMIYCKSFERDGQYFTLTDYNKIY